MLLILNQHNNHVSADTINEFEGIILKDSMVQEAKPVNTCCYKTLFLLYRTTRKLGFSSIMKTKRSSLSSPLNDSKHIFTVMMGLDEAKYKPYAFSTNHCRSIFLFDAWEKDYDKIIEFVEKYKIDFVFITALQSAINLNKLLTKKNVYWIPEGINTEDYTYNDYKNKSIDVLAVGRKYDAYHNQIKDYLIDSNRTYLYEKVKGEIVFPSRKEFIDGMADTKISICFPSNLTHPERAGSIETMTIRYLQSMVSKCIIVGHAPKEMIDLFGYNPIIEVDYTNPTKQLNDVLANYKDYIPLVEKNYINVVENHTWEKRWSKIKQVYTENSKK